MEWVTIDVPNDVETGLTTREKGGGWVWGKAGSPEDRQTAQSKKLTEEQRLRDLAEAMGGVAAAKVQDAKSAAAQRAISFAAAPVRSVWEAHKQNLQLTCMVLGVIAIHGSVSWMRPALNTAFSVATFDPMGRLIDEFKPVSFSSQDTTPLKKGDRVGEFIVTSGFGHRNAPTAGASTFHRGVDLNTPTDTPVYAPKAGNVDCQYEAEGYGHYINAQWGMIGHLSECYGGFKQQGDLIGLTGATGIGTGPHADIREGAHPNFINPTRGFVEAVMGIQSQKGVNLTSHTISATANTKAFLDVIAWAEGSDYDTLVGGGKIHDLSHHPNQRVWINTINDYSTAAGRYQFIDTTWNQYSRDLGLRDFSPASQDKAAIAVLANNDVPGMLERGAIEQAFCAVGNVWASLPCNSYGQPQENSDELVQKYYEFGGGSLHPPRSRTLDLLNRGERI
ncbi:MAG: peptidoglycan DD-metalloendopeptidase family protein [Cyanobacteria bacterium P01_F01_bin.150]